MECEAKDLMKNNLSTANFKVLAIRLLKFSQNSINYSSKILATSVSKFKIFVTKVILQIEEILKQKILEKVK